MWFVFRKCVGSMVLVCTWQVLVVNFIKSQSERYC